MTFHFPRSTPTCNPAKKHNQAKVVSKVPYMYYISVEIGPSNPAKAYEMGPSEGSLYLHLKLLKPPPPPNFQTPPSIMGGETAIRRTVNTFPKLSEGPVGQQIHSIYKGRLGTFTDRGQYASQNLWAYVAVPSLEFKFLPY